MKTKEQVIAFRNLLLHSKEEVSKDPKKYGVEDVDMFCAIKRIQLEILDYVLDGE